MPDDLRIGAIIRELRKRRGQTQEGLARLTDRSVDAISQIERDVNSPNVDTLLRIASALGVSPATIFTPLEGKAVERQKWMAVAIAELSELSDRDLEIAIRQLQAFNR